MKKALLSAKNEYKNIRVETQRLIDGQEGRDIDFKVKPDGLKAEDFVALANARGGSILVGVEERSGKNGKQYGAVVGCAINDKVRQAFISTAASCRPAMDISISIENTGSNKPIYRIDVPEGSDKPYCTSAGLYKIRAEGQNIAIDPPLMKAIILEKEAKEFVARFRAAGNELLKQINRVHEDLVEQIQSVELAAHEATEAAQAAEQAALDAQMYAGN